MQYHKFLDSSHFVFSSFFESIIQFIGFEFAHEFMPVNLPILIRVDPLE